MSTGICHNEFSLYNLPTGVLYILSTGVLHILSTGVLYILPTGVLYILPTGVLYTYVRTYLVRTANRKGVVRISLMRVVVGPHFVHIESNLRGKGAHTYVWIIMATHKHAKHTVCTFIGIHRHTKHRCRNYV